MVKVLDFGISKQMSESGAPPPLEDAARTRTSAWLGSPLYMSPEQMRSARDVDLRTDIWALGLILFELCTEHVPFDAPSVVELCGRVLHDEPTPLETWLPDPPPALASVIARCLRKNRDERFADVAQLARALGPLAPGSRARVDRIIAIVDGAATTDPGPSSDEDAQPLPLLRPSAPSHPEKPRATKPEAVAAHTSVRPEGPLPEPEEKPRRRGALWLGLVLVLVLAGGAGGAFLPTNRWPFGVSRPPPPREIRADTAPSVVPPPVVVSAAPLPPAPVAVVPAPAPNLGGRRRRRRTLLPPRRGRRRTPPRGAQGPVPGCGRAGWDGYRAGPGGRAEAGGDWRGVLPEHAGRHEEANRLPVGTTDTRRGQRRDMNHFGVRSAVVWTAATALAAAAACGGSAARGAGGGATTTTSLGTTTSTSTTTSTTSSSTTSTSTTTTTGTGGGSAGCLPAAAYAGTFTIDDPAFCAVAVYTAGEPPSSQPSWGSHGGPLTVVLDSAGGGVTLERWTAPAGAMGALTKATAHVAAGVPMGANLGAQANDLPFFGWTAIAWTGPGTATTGQIALIAAGAVASTYSANDPYWLAGFTGGAAEGRLLHTGLSPIGAPSTDVNGLYAADACSSPQQELGAGTGCGAPMRIDAWDEDPGPIALNKNGDAFVVLVSPSTGTQEARGYGAAQVASGAPPVMGATLFTVDGYSGSLAALTPTASAPGLLVFQPVDETTNDALDVIEQAYTVSGGVVAASGTAAKMLTVPAMMTTGVSFITDGADRLWVAVPGGSSTTYVVLQRSP